MTYTFDSDIVSDLHKDAYGFRPSQAWYAQWNTNTDAEKQTEWDRLVVALEESSRRENEMETISITIFEKRIADTITVGAGNREVALRWMMDASDAGGDWDYFAYLNGLPYTYFRTFDNYTKE